MTAILPQPVTTRRAPVTTRRAPVAAPTVETLPEAPLNPLPYRQRLAAVKSYHTGTELLRDAGGPVTKIVLGPRWLMPPIVLATSPQAIRDVLAVRDGTVDKMSPVFAELRAVLGENLVDLPHDRWLPRRRTIQPVFTKARISALCGHVTAAASSVGRQWEDGSEIDLGQECRKLTLRTLGKSVFGLDLDDQAERIEEPLQVAMTHAVRRALRPLRAPAWLPTPARRRARQASAELHRLADDILQACRADPNRDAPLVQALLAATDPETGRGLTDREIRDELIIFLFAGHDTVATTITYALWQLGRHLAVQDQVAAEVAALGDHELTSADLPALEYTSQVVKEALRLCPPAPTGTRTATRDLEVGGYRVPAGTTLAFGRMAVQRDPALWDNPLAFDPSRFSSSRSAGRDRWQYLPFGGGARSCIGDHFAMMEATLALATLLREVEIHSTDETFPLAVHFTLVADGPVRARVRRRP
ncbi:cytochrome P450 [Mycolicibacterium confluentis]|uniref:Cytochrome P450 n=1 Tax=Mycolicibacterium confluentis TaxID=28047 RepID=A0A7I7Y1T7_9MYCO|nr:cytochrome P450 [Mycolicibacterium confluentis]MCV7320549.1 cytochrome P450 [Mycolicibacterium confluentis]BBZ35588.1 cytochrome P450 [Mycolicibacterium confluentis]